MQEYGCGKMNFGNMQVSEERKMAAHAGACRAAGVSFIPLVVESLGGWRYEAIQTKELSVVSRDNAWDFEREAHAQTNVALRVASTALALYSVSGSAARARRCIY